MDRVRLAGRRAGGEGLIARLLDRRQSDRYEFDEPPLLPVERWPLPELYVEEREASSVSIVRFFKELPILIGVALLIAMVIKAFVVQAFYIEQESMLPTLEPAQRVLVGKYSYRFGKPARGDVVIFKDPRSVCAGEQPPEFTVAPECNPGVTRKVLDWFAEVFGLPTGSKDDLVKRIAGLPGETIAMYSGEVFVCDAPGCDPVSDDGIPIDGRKIDFPSDADAGPEEDQSNFSNYTIPAESYFMLGDNRDSSADSRSFRAVKRDAFVGKVVLRIWPPGRVRGG